MGGNMKVDGEMKEVIESDDNLKKKFMKNNN